MSQFIVLELRIELKYDLEDVRKEVFGKILKAMGGWAKPAIHARTSCSFLAVSTETSAEFQRRLSPTLEEISSIDNYRCHVAPKVAVARHGLDTYVHWLDAAWKRAGQLNEQENMRKAKFGRHAAWRV